MQDIDLPRLYVFFLFWKLFPFQHWPLLQESVHCFHFLNVVCCFKNVGNSKHCWLSLVQNVQTLLVVSNRENLAIFCTLWRFHLLWLTWMDSSEKTEIQIKFANWDKWLGAAWNLYSTKGWLLNFTNSDGEINGLCIRGAASYLTPPDQYKKTFYLQLRVCVSYLDVSLNERFLASSGCLPTNNSLHSYDCIFHKVLLSIQSLFFWNISH